MYASYTAAVMPRHLDLAAKYGVNLLGAVTWAFEFEDQPYFDGFRDLATNGIDKPVLNVFRMLGMMTGNRAAVENPAATSLESMLAAGVKDKPDVHAMAARDAHSAAVLVSNYHDSAKTGPTRADRSHHRRAAARPHPGGALPRRRRAQQLLRSLEEDGIAAQPTPEQYAQLEAAGQLQLLTSPRWIASDGSIHITFDLPLHGVSLIRLTW